MHFHYYESRSAFMSNNKTCFVGFYVEDIKGGLKRQPIPVIIWGHAMTMMLRKEIVYASVRKSQFYPGFIKH